MKLVMTLLVRNEEDIIAANLDFHLHAGVDHFIVMDHRSTDLTRDILCPYKARGLVTYVFQPEERYAQNVWVTSMARRAYTEFRADWVINNDADEFWWPDQGDLKTSLADVPAQWLAAYVARSNFVPVNLSPGGFFADVMTLRETRSLNALGEPLPGKTCHRGMAVIEVATGNHAVGLGGQKVPAAPVPINILHFPMRSYPQFESKIVDGGTALERNSAYGPKAIATWRHLLELWRRGELRAYYDAQVPRTETIAAGLREGRYITDERLKRVLAALRDGRGSNR